MRIGIHRDIPSSVCALAAPPSLPPREPGIWEGRDALLSTGRLEAQRAGCGGGEACARLQQHDLPPMAVALKEVAQSACSSCCKSNTERLLLLLRCGLCRVGVILVPL